jgi:predicted RNA-binding Zn-ribbon protein involved in translation (DUF1610 family)
MSLHGLMSLFLSAGTTTEARPVKGHPGLAVVAINTGAMDINLHVRDVAIACRLVESLQAAIALARTGVTFECPHCNKELPVVERSTMRGFEDWCRSCADNYEPGDPPTEEAVAAHRQQHLGEGVSYNALKGR